MTQGKFQRFKDWFTNVFWYHYKWWFLLGVFLVCLIIFVTVESVMAEDYDMTVVFGQSGEITEQQAQAVLDAIAPAVGDLNGDGRVLLNYVSVNLVDSTLEGGGYEGSYENSQSRMLLYLSESDYVLFFLDSTYSTYYTGLEYFEDKLADYGIETDPEDPYRVFVGDSEVFVTAGLTGFEYYGHLMDWTTVGKGSREAVDAAVNALGAVIR